MAATLDAGQTVARLPWPALVDEIEALLRDDGVRIPERIVMPTAHGAVLFVMPGCDARVAMTKLITFTPTNGGSATPTIQGDVTVFDVVSGTRRLILDGPTVTARRTAAVSALGARWLAPDTAGPMLIVGAGVQGRAHLEVFAQVLGVRRFAIASRSRASAQALVDHAQALGLQAEVAPDADAALADCPLVVTCTPASGVVLRASPRADAFIAAVGAFTPQMVELAPALCRHVADHGRIVVDTREAEHEAGDLLQAGIDVGACPSLGDVVRAGQRGGRGPVLFKSCGWAGWDLAAARLAMRE
ncbi:MAG: delta(1)-pyrroline-2-carboxylate reductase family protein [Proteobacteria bacterium]|nr:delta(1)-pyrroline-2-carboxylate reductase family protein [Pseudomonadota bacterium]